MATTSTSTVVTTSRYVVAIELLWPLNLYNVLYSAICEAVAGLFIQVCVSEEDFLLVYELTRRKPPEFHIDNMDISMLS